MLVGESFPPAVAGSLACEAITEAGRTRSFTTYAASSGPVVKGDQRGRELGFPTANVPTPTGFGLLQGVYAVRARLGDRLLDGVASYGKPMFNNERPPFETWIFDFDEDIYGQSLDVALLGTVRGQAKFGSLDELIAAVNNDAAQARHLLKATLPVSDLDGRLGFFR